MAGPEPHTITGACLCKKVTVHATPVRDGVEACHCSMCRNWNGGPLLSVQCGTDVRFEGEQHIERYASSGWAERGFCKRCGTHLFFHFVPADHYAIPAGLFDVELGSLSEEIFIDEKPSYYAFLDGAHRKTGAEIIAEAEAAGFTFE